MKIPTPFGLGWRACALCSLLAVSALFPGCGEAEDEGARTRGSTESLPLGAAFESQRSRMIDLLTDSNQLLTDFRKLVVDNAGGYSSTPPDAATLRSMFISSPEAYLAMREGAVAKVRAVERPDAAAYKQSVRSAGSPMAAMETVSDWLLKSAAFIRQTELAGRPVAPEYPPGVNGAARAAIGEDYGRRIKVFDGIVSVVNVR